MFDLEIHTHSRRGPGRCTATSAAARSSTGPVPAPGARATEPAPAGGGPFPASRLRLPPPRRLLALLATAGLASALGACGGDPHPGAAEPAGEPVAVRTAVAAYRTVPEVVEASGGVEPWRRVSPGTKILGRIEAVPVREGDRVERGALLAQLERRDLEAAVRQAEAAVAQAEAQLENAAIQHRRMETLHARGSVTDKNLEDAAAAHRVTAAAVERARAELAAAEVTLSYAQVRSPVAGWVVERRVEAGDMAAPGQPLFTVEDLSRVKVTVEVPEAGVVGLEPGDPATAVVDVLGAERAAAVHRVVPAGDPASRTFRVQVVLENPDGRIKSGMFARARFARGERRLLAVPAGTVVERGQLRGLFTLDDRDRARLRWVQLGRRLDGEVEVLSGLEAGERLLVDPPPGLVDGTPVAPTPAAEGGLEG